MAWKTGLACGLTLTRSPSRSQQPMYNAVRIETTEALLAWWPPTLVPSVAGRTWLASWIMRVASHSTRCWMRSNTSTSTPIRSQRTRTLGRMAVPVTVDFHAHAQSPRAAELISQAPNQPRAQPNPHNEHLQRTRYHAAFTDLNVRLQTMDRQRIDMQVISPAPNYAYWADEDLSPRIAQASNEHIAEIC